MPVQGLFEQLLIQEVPNESDRSSEDEETVEGASLEVLGRLLLGEGTRAVEEIAEGGGDASVDVEDERVLLGGGDVLDTESVVHGGTGKRWERKRRRVSYYSSKPRGRTKDSLGGEGVVNKVLEELDSEIGVGLGLDLVTDTGDWRDEGQGRVH